jgi:glycosyltransferase involved in cell wall biosynthesis
MATPLAVALINEGTYPYATGGVSTWCEQLVRGLSEVSWHLVTIVASGSARLTVPLPANVRSLTTVPVWGAGRRPRHRALAAAYRVCRGMLGDTEADRADFAHGLRELAAVAAARPMLAYSRTTGRQSKAAVQARPAAGRHPLYGVPLADLLLDAWAEATGRGAALPRLTLREADEAAIHLEHAVRPLSVSVPTVDMVHANANGLSSLIALATKWRTGVPFVMTEHGVYLRERYLAAADQSPGVKAALLRFHRALARLAYTEADAITPVSAFNMRWEVRHGADPWKVQIIPNGVDPKRYDLVAGTPDTPTISWVGRIDPLKDLETLIQAVAMVRRKVPGTRLHLAGPVPAGNEAYAQTCRSLVAELGLTEAVTFAGPCETSRAAFAVGHVAALSSISEGMPYTIVEAMMCGRPTVSTDVGGVAEMIGDTGLVVRPRDPATFAAACVSLLDDGPYRADLAAKARARALELFTVDRCVGSYRDRYLALTGRAPVETAVVEAIA